MARLGGIAFAYYKQFFPKAHTLVDKHLHKAVETPIIVHHAVAYLPLAPLFGSLALLLLDDHLPLGKIADHHSPFSQSVCDEMGGFMQIVLLFAPLLLRNPLVDLGEVNVAAGFLLALVALGADLIKLFVVVAIALEAADVVKTSLIIHTRRQCLNAQVKGYDAVIAQGARLAFLLSLVSLVLLALLLLGIIVHERAIIVPPRIFGDG